MLEWRRFFARSTDQSAVVRGELKLTAKIRHIASHGVGGQCCAVMTGADARDEECRELVRDIGEAIDEPKPVCQPAIRGVIGVAKLRRLNTAGSHARYGRTPLGPRVAHEADRLNSSLPRSCAEPTTLSSRRRMLLPRPTAAAGPIIRDGERPSCY